MNEIYMEMLLACQGITKLIFRTSQFSINKHQKFHNYHQNLEPMFNLVIKKKSKFQNGHDEFQNCGQLVSMS